MGRKVTDGKAIDVSVPGNTAFAIAKGDFVLLEGIFGMNTSLESIATFGTAQPMALQIEQAVYECGPDQMLVTDAFADGVDVYWDNTNRRFTTTVGANRKVGRVILPKTSGNVFWMLLYPQLG